MTGGAVPRDDVEYFRARAVEEQIAAANAKTAEARDRHDELATMYRFRVAMLLTGSHGRAGSLARERTGTTTEVNVGDDARATTDRT